MCRWCAYSFYLSGNNDKCPLCNSDQAGKTDEEINKEIRKRVEAKDPGAMSGTSWLLVITMEEKFSSRITQSESNFMSGQQSSVILRLITIRQMRSNCTLEQQSLVVVRHIVTWVTFIIKREIRRRPNSTSRQLWQDTKWQGATLEAWSVTLETWNELSKYWKIAASGGEYRAMQLFDYISQKRSYK
jgi:hypothetical protein